MIFATFNPEILLENRNKKNYIHLQQVFCKILTISILILANNKVNVKKFFMFLVGRVIYPIELMIAASDTHYIANQHFPHALTHKVFCQK